MAEFRERVTIRRRNWRRTLASFAPFAMLLAVLGVALARLNAGAPRGSGGGSFVALLLLSAIVPIVLQRFGFGVRRESEVVHATADGLSVNGVVVLRREQMAEGFIRGFDGGPIRVRIVGARGGRSIDLELSSRERALELLRALKLDVLHRTLEVRGIVNFRYMNIPARIVVGADGLLVTHAGFFAYETIDRIERDGAAVVVQRKDGVEALRLFVGTRADVLVERLREGLEASRRGPAPEDAAALVARRDRPAGEWLRELKAVLGRRDYRTASVTAEALWRIVDDPGASVSARAGAATALRAVLDDDGRGRLRVAAQASASPALRVVLEAASARAEGEAEAGAREADEAPLVRALEACRDE